MCFIGIARLFVANGNLDVCHAASLALHLSDDLLDEVNKTLISKLQQNNIKAEAARTYVQTIGAVRCSTLICKFIVSIVAWAVLN